MVGSAIRGIMEGEERKVVEADENQDEQWRKSKDEERVVEVFEVKCQVEGGYLDSCPQRSCLPRCTSQPLVPAIVSSTSHPRSKKDYHSLPPLPFTPCLRLTWDVSHLQKVCY